MFDLDNELRLIVRGVMSNDMNMSSEACGRIRDEDYRKRVLHSRTLNAFQSWFITHDLGEAYDEILNSVEGD